uniref:Cell division protein n=1 Tax=Carteria sp. SAG 8-5 TaxID=1756294 RepID=A0A0S2LPK6_9CHLO|nr:cell division protein [Carteria sp. SAG 8-5]
MIQKNNYAALHMLTKLDLKRTFLKNSFYTYNFQELRSMDEKNENLAVSPLLKNESNNKNKILKRGTKKYLFLQLLLWKYLNRGTKKNTVFSSNSSLARKKQSQLNVTFEDETKIIPWILLPVKKIDNKEPFLSLPNRKSFFSYWLLPFFGFVGSITNGFMNLPILERENKTCLEYGYKIQPSNSKESKFTEATHISNLSQRSVLNWHWNPIRPNVIKELSFFEKDSLFLPTTLEIQGKNNTKFFPDKIKLMNYDKIELISSVELPFKKISAYRQALNIMDTLKLRQSFLLNNNTETYNSKNMNTTVFAIKTQTTKKSELFKGTVENSINCKSDISSLLDISHDDPLKVIIPKTQISKKGFFWKFSIGNWIYSIFHRNSHVFTAEEVSPASLHEPIDIINKNKKTGTSIASPMGYVKKILEPFLKESSNDINELRNIYIKEAESAIEIKSLFYNHPWKMNHPILKGSASNVKQNILFPKQTFSLRSPFGADGQKSKTFLTNSPRSVTAKTYIDLDRYIYYLHSKIKNYFIRYKKNILRGNCSLKGRMNSIKKLRTQYGRLGTKTNKRVQSIAIDNLIQNRKIEKLFRYYLYQFQSETLKSLNSSQIHQKKTKKKANSSVWAIQILRSNPTILKNESTSEFISGLDSSGVLKNPQKGDFCKNGALSIHLLRQWFHFSPSLLLQNRSFLSFKKMPFRLRTTFNKEETKLPEVSNIQTTQTPQPEIKENQITNEDIRKNQQKKRRLKKQRRETRRRKKRKRWFPRPLWLRYSLYEKFLKKRHLLINTNRFFSSRKLTDRQAQTFLDRNFLINDLLTYQEARTRLRLTRVKPYFNKIKNSMKKIRNSFTPLSGAFKLRAKASYKKDINFQKIQDDKKIKDKSIEVSKLSYCKSDISSNNLQKPALQAMLHHNGPFLKIVDISNWEQAFYIAKYYQNLSLRIQEAIFSPFRKELPPQVTKVDFSSYKKTPEKTKSERDSLNNNQVQNRNTVGRSKIRKNLFLDFKNKRKSLYSPKKPLFFKKSNLQTAWALNKANLFFSGSAFKGSTLTTQPSPSIRESSASNILLKDIWTRQKIRDQLKSNKTKKIFYQIQKKLSHILFSTYSYTRGKNLDLRTFKNKELKINYLLHHLKKENRPLRKNDSNNILSTKSIRECSTDTIFQLHNPFSFWWLETMGKQSASIPISASEIHLKNEFYFRNSFFKQVNAIEYGSPLNLALVLCVSMFHVCSLFSLITISQIRCVLKFYFLVFYKISGTSFQVFFSIVHLIISTSQFLLSSLFNVNVEPTFFTSQKSKVEYSQEYQTFIHKFSKKEPSQIFSALTLNIRDPAIDSLQQYQTFNKHEFKPLDTNQFRFYLRRVEYRYIKPFLKIRMFYKLYLYRFYKKASFFAFLSLVSFINILESWLRLFYLLLEKPTEIIMDWVAQLFLVEWLSDLTPVMPDSVESSMWNYFLKTTRGIRVFGPLGLLIQRRFWNFFEMFLEIVNQPDTDLIRRQKKGILFWDHWLDLMIKNLDKSVNLTDLNSENLILENIILDKWVEPQSHLFTKNNRKAFDFESVASKPTKSPDECSRIRISSSLPLSSIEVGQVGTNWKYSYTPLNIWKEEITKAKTFRDFLSNDTDSIMTGEANPNKWKRWAANQYFVFASKLQPDLFIDVHLPTSLNEANRTLDSQLKHSIKYKKWYGLTLKTKDSNNSRNKTVWYDPLSLSSTFNMDSSSYSITGNLICQIFSGLFLKQTAKNVLVIGDQKTDKTLLIKAIAGETEFKMITDNANRYTLVINGLPVGIRLLKDVFDAIIMHTPCLFLLEEIHVIGERRALLVSEDKIFSDPVFGDHSEQVPERNQTLYTLTRHQLAYYRKPFIGSSDSVLYSQETEIIEPFMHPLPLSGFDDSAEQPLNIKKSNLELTRNKLFAPPATSPFSILVMKEQKKFKPKKIVNEIPWSGIPMEQLVLLPRLTYSIKAKVLLLVEKAVENLYVKVNMITDLLLIIDSVRSNRGFIVFATTHVPSMLDPALRRPGRFDETISLPFVDNLVKKWQVFPLRAHRDVELFSKSLKNIEFNIPLLQRQTLLLKSVKQNGIYTISNSQIETKRNKLFESKELSSDRQIQKSFSLLHSKTYNQITTLIDSTLPIDFLSDARFDAGQIYEEFSYPKKNNLYRNKKYRNIFTKALLDIAPIFLHQLEYQQSIEIQKLFINSSLKKDIQLRTAIMTFDDILLTDMSLQEVPSAPFSRVTLPSRRFENYKRAEKNLQRKVSLSIKEKMQLHQNQKMMKRLYGMFVQKEELSTKKSKQINKIPTNLEKHSRIPVSTNWFYKNKIYNRHRMHLINQWWNGQLPEHNREETFASDVDWRIFGSIVPAALAEKTNSENLDNIEKNIITSENTSNNELDVNFDIDLYEIDFPDSEQYYNPKQRRWMLTSGYWSYWFGLEMTQKNQSGLNRSFQKDEKLYKKREKIDFLAYKLLETGLLDEVDFSKKL